MRLNWTITTTLLCASAFTAASSAATITYIGTGLVPGDALDFSGLTGKITGGAGTIPHNLLGAFGSGITYTGAKNLYVMVNDRGYSDGITTPSYLNRFQIFTITVNATAKTVTPTLVDTRLMLNEQGQNLVGQTSEFSLTAPSTTLRFDPESVRLGRDGTIFVSDEYGPYIYQFDQTGRRIRSLPVPSYYGIAKPSPDGAAELANNTVGRQSNRGMEGLAISPDGTTLFGLMQNALLQDGALNSALSRRGVNTRILKMDIATGATKEYVYQLENGTDNGLNDILAINDHEFLAIERDGRVGSAAVTKKIYRIDITGASDVSSSGTTATNGLPQTGALAFTPVKKSEFINLLDPKFGLAGDSFPEKVEGLAWGPDFPDGSHLLLVTTDNDLIQANPTRIYAFQVSADTFTIFQKQQIDVPFANVRQGTISFSNPLPAYNIRTHQTELRITFKNTGSTAIAGPVSVSFPGQARDVVLQEQDGASGGVSFRTISSGDMAPGAEVTLTVRFANPANQGITLNPQFYSGSF
jgi:hypothetical protein